MIHKILYLSLLSQALRETATFDPETPGRAARSPMEHGRKEVQGDVMRLLRSVFFFVHCPLFDVVWTSFSEGTDSFG